MTKYENMTTLNYIVGKEKKYKLTLIADNIFNIDKATIKKNSPLSFINQPMYDEQIGIFLYDHEDEISEEEIKHCELKIECSPTLEDLTALSSKISWFKDKQSIRINPIFSNDCYKIDLSLLEKSIIEKNKNFDRYLKQLAKSKNYYLYLRIIDSYYDQFKSTIIKK